MSEQPAQQAPAATPTETPAPAPAEAEAPQAADAQPEQTTQQVAPLADAKNVVETVSDPVAEPVSEPAAPAEMDQEVDNQENHPPAAPPSNAPAIESTGGFYSYDQLKVGAVWPPDVEPSKRESYLTELEFAKVFEMSKEEFYKKPIWRQKQLKENLELF